MLRRQELGHRLRGMRSQAQMTMAEVADRLMVSATKISRIESGARGVSYRDIQDLCLLYGADDEERRQLMALARQGRERSWWHGYRLPFSALIDFENAAAAISDYKSAIVPGLLQTEAYARQLFQARVPPLEPGTLTQRLEARMTRQDLVKNRSVQFLFVLDEAVLHRVVGGMQVMHEQLWTVLDRAGQTNVELRILPFSSGAHPALESNFTLIELEEGEASPAVVYVEGLLGNHYLRSEAGILRYRGVLDSLMDCTLTASASADVIRTFIDRYAP